MKLIRFGEPGAEKPGVELDNGKWVDVSGFCTDFDEKFFNDNGIENLQDWLKERVNLQEIAKEIRLGPPIFRPSKIVCIGLNYQKHAEETGADIPKEPIIFFKATSAIVGPNDDLIIPKGSNKTD